MKAFIVEILVLTLCSTAAASSPSRPKLASCEVNVAAPAVPNLDLVRLRIVKGAERYLRLNNLTLDVIANFIRDGLREPMPMDEAGRAFMAFVPANGRLLRLDFWWRPEADLIDIVFFGYHTQRRDGLFRERFFAESSFRRTRTKFNANEKLLIQASKQGLSIEALDEAMSNPVGPAIPHQQFDNQEWVTGTTADGRSISFVYEIKPSAVKHLVRFVVNDATTGPTSVKLN